MSDSNLIFVFSPEGEPFETSKANARDLTAHAGWTYGPPAHQAAAATETAPPPPPPAKEETPPPPPPAKEETPPPPPPAAEEKPAAKPAVTIEEVEVTAPAKAAKKADAAE